MLCKLLATQQANKHTCTFIQGHEMYTVLTNTKVCTTHKQTQLCLRYTFAEANKQTSTHTGVHLPTFTSIYT